MTYLLNRIGRLTLTNQLELCNEIFLIELCQLLMHVFGPVFYTFPLKILTTFSKQP